MQTIYSKSIAVNIADLTFQLLSRCQMKEVMFAKKFDISVAGFRCLRHLHEHKRVTVKQLAENMNLTSSRLTRIVDELVKNKYVTRQEQPSDRRMFIISLTQAGEDLAYELYSNFNKLHEQIFSAIPILEQKAITESLERILKSFDLWFKKDELDKWDFLKPTKHNQ